MIDSAAADSFRRRCLEGLGLDPDNVPPRSPPKLVALEEKVEEHDDALRIILGRLEP